jgi:hypothetical protein
MALVYSRSFQYYCCYFSLSMFFLYRLKTVDYTKCVYLLSVFLVLQNDGEKKEMNKKATYFVDKLVAN